MPVIATVRLEKNEDIYYHAVVISGYGCNQQRIVNELYVHDDQIGPYSRVVSDGKFVEWKSEWTLRYDREIVEKVLIPIYPKIRLTFGRIYEVYLREKQSILSKGFNAELFLIQVREYKEFLWNHFIEDKTEILTTILPRFLWVIRSLLDGVPIIDDVYDGTSVFPKRLLTVRFL